MSNGDLIARVRAVRDGKMTPQDSWRFRHGHTFMGYTFKVWSLKELSKIGITDLEYFLLIAAAEIPCTDLQLYLSKSCEGDDREILSGLHSELIKAGYMPVSFTGKMIGNGQGWLRIGLFTPDDLPDSPFGDVSSV